MVRVGGVCLTQLPALPRHTAQLNCTGMEQPRIPEGRRSQLSGAGEKLQSALPMVHTPSQARVQAQCTWAPHVSTEAAAGGIRGSSVARERCTS